MKPPPEILTSISSPFQTASPACAKGSKILSLATLGSKTSIGTLLTRILPLPTLTVARATAVFLLPLVNKTLVELDILFTNSAVPNFLGIFANRNIRTLQLINTSLSNRLKSLIFKLKRHTDKNLQTPKSHLPLRQTTRKHAPTRTPDNLIRTPRMIRSFPKMSFFKKSPRLLNTTQPLT